MDGAFSVDVEQDLHSKNFKGIRQGIPKLVELLSKYHIKATFFVTGQVIEKYPQIIKKLASQGHEIAIHGYAHKRYDSMNSRQKREDLVSVINAYKKVFNKNPKGFRSPQHSIDKETLELLYLNNIKYDSSKTPGNFMLFRHLFKNNIKKINILNNFFSHLWPYKIKENFIEIPRTAFLLSVGGFEIKVYPAIFYRLIISLCRIFKIPFIFVMHSWDMIDTPGSRTSKICPKSLFEKKIAEFLDYSSKKISYRKMEEFL